MACERCADFGGLWMETPSGLARCVCRPPVVKAQPRPPVLTAKQADFFVEMLAAVPFFPGEPGARASIADELRGMCAGPKEAEWLVTRMRRLYQRWPGVLEMRRVYTSKFPPHDALEPIGESEHYPDGIPSERKAQPLALPTPDRKLLASGQVDEPVAAPESHAIVQKLARALKMPKAQPVNSRFSRSLDELLTAPADRPELSGPTPQVITQADIDAAVTGLRAKKATEA